MVEMSEELKNLRNSDPDIVLIMDTFQEIEQTYNASVKANEFVEEISPIMNTAGVEMSFQSPLSCMELKEPILVRTDRNNKED